MKHTTNVVSDLIPPSQETTLANQSTLDHHQVPVAAAFRMPYALIRKALQKLLQQLHLLAC